MAEEISTPPRRIEIPGDVLVLDEEWCALAGGIDRRTSQRFDASGCPFIYVGNRKYRPLGEARAWLAKRIERRNRPRASRRTVAA